MTKEELKATLKLEVQKPTALMRLLYMLRLKAVPERLIIAKFLKTLRYSEYYKSNFNKGLFHKFMALVWHNRLEKMRVRLKFDIPLFVFGPGLKIAHLGVINVNRYARIGKNCTIISSTLIGHKKSGSAPRLGDNVFLGTNSCIIGDITIGSHVFIGQNVVITKDIPDQTTMICMPPRELKRKQAGKQEAEAAT